MLEERKEALEREIILRGKSVQDAENKMKQTLDEIEIKIYHINDQAKVINEMRLRIDCADTKI